MKYVRLGVLSLGVLTYAMAAVKCKRARPPRRGFGSSSQAAGLRGLGAQQVGNNSTTHNAMHNIMRTQYSRTAVEF